MFHKEGFKIIFITLLISTIGILLAGELIHDIYIQKWIQVPLFVFTLLVLQFFRNPKRHTMINDLHILAPVDGKIVAIEEVVEQEYFKEKRVQISIFMTPLNVHVTRYPIGGKVLYSQYHHGKYLVASHPKSSTENERTTIVINNKTAGAVMYRQVAGFVARRIVNYAMKDARVTQGEDSGFIKFGSRVDVFVPLNFDVQVQIGDKVKGGERTIAIVKDKELNN